MRGVEFISIPVGHFQVWGYQGFADTIFTVLECAGLVDHDLQAHNVFVNIIPVSPSGLVWALMLFLSASVSGCQHGQVHA